MKTAQTGIDQKTKVNQVIKLLEKQYPNAKTALNWSNPLELLVATMLSAQTTDVTVNSVTKTLFKKYLTAKDYAEADLKELEAAIHSTGYYHNKAKNLKECTKLLVEKFDGKVPKTMEELTELPGIARKTANIILYNAYGITAGIAVDTHVMRLSQKIGLTQQKYQDKIEKDLMHITPKDKWMPLTDLLIFHGRQVCNAKKPRCEICVLNEICPSALIPN
ncbi:MAG: endonuclease III [Candidatus Bathyarchaeia archaeon]|nr:endonuclease III [Candidatus Bathyarchaeota archaeon]MDI9577033.1 endonuclease III [Thermoproteota archaeon]